MSTRPSRPPKYRHYKPKNLAVVRIDGHDHYLGKYGSPESHERYERLIAEWRLTRQSNQRAPRSAAVSTVNELLLVFMRHAEQRYVKKPSKRLGHIFFKCLCCGLQRYHTSFRWRSME